MPSVCGGAAFRPDPQAPICSVQGVLGLGPGSGGWLPAAPAALGPRRAQPGLLSGAGLVRGNVLTGVFPAQTVVVSYREPRRGEREAVPAGWRRVCVLPQWAGNETRPVFLSQTMASGSNPRSGRSRTGSSRGGSGRGVWTAGVDGRRGWQSRIVVTAQLGAGCRGLSFLLCEMGYQQSGRQRGPHL